MSFNKYPNGYKIAKVLPAMNNNAGIAREKILPGKRFYPSEFGGRSPALKDFLLMNDDSASCDCAKGCRFLRGRDERIL